VVANWWGDKTIADWGILHENTRHILDYCRRADLHFLLNYEDRPLVRLTDTGLVDHAGAVAMAQADLRYAEAHWFSDPRYVSHAGRPVFTVFGPYYLVGDQDWDDVFAPLASRPLLFTVFPLPFADGRFYWLPVGPGLGGDVSAEQLATQMDEFHRRASGWPAVLSGAAPGFDDYPVAGTAHPSSYGHIDYDGDGTLRRTLARAIAAVPDVVQIITWNDFNEGTMIEPTEEFGFLFLEAIQDVRRAELDPAFPYTPEDLRLALRIYTLRKAHPGDAAINAALDQAVDHLLHDDLAAAVALVESLEHTQP
jgi:hypothetical protein